MLSTRKLVISAIALLVMSLHSGHAAADGKLYKTLKSYYEDVMPGQGFVPTPYGADGRFAPKSIWLFAPNVLKGVDGKKTKSGWIAASSGEPIYPGTMVPVFSDPINLTFRTKDKETAWALAASLSGALNKVNVDAEIEAAIKSGAEIKITPGETVVEYVNYFDMALAQSKNKQTLNQLRTALSNRWGPDLPERRVVIAAIKSKGGSIEIKSNKEYGVDLKAALSVIADAFGLSFNSSKEVYESLELPDWRYVAFVSQLTNEQGEISEGAGEEGLNSPFESDDVYAPYPYSVARSD